MSGCACRQHTGTCPNELSESKNVLCRPCAKGWHQRQTCATYVPEPIAPHLFRRCRTCGFDSAAHPVPVGAFT